MDALLPIDHHARAYARKVAGARSPTEGWRPHHDERDAPYRLYEVQNGNHIETYQDAFPQLALIEPHAHAAFDLLVAHVETRAALAGEPVRGQGRADHVQPGAAGALRGAVRALTRALRRSRRGSGDGAPVASAGADVTDAGAGSTCPAARGPSAGRDTHVPPQHRSRALDDDVGGLDGAGHRRDLGRPRAGPARRPRNSAPSWRGMWCVGQQAHAAFGQVAHAQLDHLAVGQLHAAPATTPSRAVPCGRPQTRSGVPGSGEAGRTGAGGGGSIEQRVDVFGWGAHGRGEIRRASRASAVSGEGSSGSVWNCILASFA